MNFTEAELNVFFETAEIIKINDVEKKAIISSVKDDEFDIDTTYKKIETLFKLEYQSQIIYQNYIWEVEKQPENNNGIWENIIIKDRKVRL